MFQKNGLFKKKYNLAQSNQKTAHMKKYYFGLAAFIFIANVANAQSTGTDPNTKKSSNLTSVKIDKKNLTPISVAAPATSVTTEQPVSPVKKEEEVKATPSKKNQPKQK